MSSIRQIVRNARSIVKAAVANRAAWYMGEEPDLDDNGEMIRGILLGSVFSLYPSGKFYMPFACSNVEPCPRCNGEGHKATPVDCHYCNGTGRRSTAQIANGDDVDETRRRIKRNLRESGKLDDYDAGNDTVRCWTCDGGLHYPECDYCHGLGSREALEDQAFQEALEAEAGKHGCWIESGEGDPCDIFISAHVDE